MVANEQKNNNLFQIDICFNFITSGHLRMIKAMKDKDKDLHF